MFDQYINATEEIANGNVPKCLVYDCESCEFSNGDSIAIENSYPRGNGYVLVLAWYDHESDMTWGGITLLVTQGNICEVDYLGIDVDGDGYEYVDECLINDSHMIGTSLYMDALEEWKAYWIACNQWA